MWCNPRGRLLAEPYDVDEPKKPKTAQDPWRRMTKECLLLRRVCVVLVLALNARSCVCVCVQSNAVFAAAGRAGVLDKEVQVLVVNHEGDDVLYRYVGKRPLTLFARLADLL